MTTVESPLRRDALQMAGREDQTDGPRSVTEVDTRNPMRNQIPKYILLLLSIAVTSGCFPSVNADPELESRIELMVEAKEIVTTENFGMLSIHVHTTDTFDLSIQDQRDLAERMAQEAIDIDSGRENITVFFVTSSVGMQMSAFMWENKNGTLRLVQE